MGVPAPSIAEAVFARAMSAIKDERVLASKVLHGPTPETSAARTGQGKSGAADVTRTPSLTPSRKTGSTALLERVSHAVIPGSENRSTLSVEAVRDALYCSKICAYAQGFQLMRAAQQEYKWRLNFADLARIWRGGCIIRARFLQKITEAFEREPQLSNLLLDPFFRDRIHAAQLNWRSVIAAAVNAGIPCPAFSSSLAYYDGYRTAVSPHNLLQAQRDYFGAHTYERVDQTRGQRFHLDWPNPTRPQSKVE
jgi:6-phosphogluconate dehydrogenase